jgi:hypothetical protein
MKTENAHISVSRPPRKLKFETNVYLYILNNVTNFHYDLISINDKKQFFMNWTLFTSALFSNFKKPLILLKESFEFQVVKLFVWGKLDIFV